MHMPTKVPERYLLLLMPIMDNQQSVMTYQRCITNCFSGSVLLISAIIRCKNPLRGSKQSEPITLDQGSWTGVCG